MATRALTALGHTRLPLRQILTPLALSARTFATAPPKNAEKDGKNDKIEPKRQPPTVLGVKERPIPDRNSWTGRQKQKLQDLTNYEKAFASHAEERRYL